MGFVRQTIALAAGVAATVSAPALAQSEIDRAYERLAGRADAQDISFCHSRLAPAIVADKDITAPPLALRERYITQVQKMDAFALVAESRRLSDLLALALDGRTVTGGFSTEELYTQSLLIDEALDKAENGQRIDPANNVYRTYVDAHPDHASEYKYAMAECLERTLPREGAQPVSQVTMPSTERRLVGRPRSVFALAPGASRALIETCREQYPSILDSSYLKALEVYLDRTRYVDSVSAMDTEGLRAESTRLWRLLDVMNAGTAKEKLANRDSLADLKARQQLVLLAQEQALQGAIIETASNPYNGMIDVAELAKNQAQDAIAVAIADCAQRAMEVPGGASTASSKGETDWMTGTFDTGGGVMRLTPAGGTYEYSNGRMTVTGINGPVMEGIWEQDSSGQKCEDGRYRGRFRLNFTEGSFTGLFGYCDEPPSAPGGFQGTRRR